jgi:hypothetical protein
MKYQFKTFRGPKTISASYLFPPADPGGFEDLGRGGTIVLINIFVGFVMVFD